MERTVSCSRQPKRSTRQKLYHAQPNFPRGEIENSALYNPTRLKCALTLGLHLQRIELSLPPSSSALRVSSAEQFSPKQALIYQRGHDYAKAESTHSSIFNTRESSATPC